MDEYTPRSAEEITAAVQELSVTAEQTGTRLDILLSELTTLSRSNIQKLIKQEQILVNDKTSKANYCVKAGDKILLSYPEPLPVDITAENIPLDIRYQDRDLAIINKPAGMVVHPAAGNYCGTLVNALLHHCQDLSGINGEIRPGIVHRLDKDTSGVMVIAKNDAAHISLAKQIETKAAQRIYLALVFGNIKQDHGEIIANIARDPKDRKRMAVTVAGGKYAHTKYRVLERFGAYTLICCKLETGRTHQIRVHMAHIGHPLVGDEKYTHIKNPFGALTQLLHSASLELTHPTTGLKIKCTAKPPPNFLKILRILRNKKYQR